MAVQDGYGKSSGSESLVFAYDLKDTVNSYRGQPATNIWTSGNPNGHGSGIQTIQTNYFLGKVIDSGVVYRNYVTNPAQSDTGTYYNNGGLNIGSMSFSNLNPSTRYIQISFDYYGVTPYRRFCCSGTGLNGYLGVTSTDSTNDTYGWDTTYSPGSGDDWNNDASRMGYWQKISLIVALRGDKNPSNIWALYIYLDAATQGEGYFANMIFTEHSTYPTGPIRWTSGTRSNTQGLLDLTGNSSIDLSNVSFNSNAQMTFDGTNDYFNLSDIDITGNFTSEAWIKNDNVTTYRTIISWGVHSASQDRSMWLEAGTGKLCLYFYPTNNNMVIGATNIADGNWHHCVATWDGTTGRVYVDGVLDGSLPLTANSYTYGGTYIGKNVADAYRFVGDISSAKIYNRVLTATEIQNNWNKHKRQYGLT